MKIRIVFILSILTALVLSGLYIHHRYQMGRRNIVTHLAEENSMINILLAGSNEYDENRHRLFIVVSINPENRKIGLTFIPPAFAVDLNEDGVAEKIGDVNPSSMSDLNAAIERELDMKIPFFAVLYSPDLSRMVDLVYGIDLFMFEPEKTTQGMTFGRNYLDGNHIVEYINIAENGSIYSKYDRIMDVVFTLHARRDQYKQFATRPLVDLALETINTNMNSREVLSLASYFFDGTSILWTLLPGKLDVSGLYVRDEIAQTVYRESFLKRLVIEETGELSLKAKLQNATDIPGLARRYRSMLMREGVNVVEFGTFEDMILNETLIIDRKGNAQAAAYLSELIGTDRVYQVIDSTQLHDVLIILGQDAAQPNQRDTVQTRQQDADTADQDDD
ncbi:MAG: LCP family protein [Spirochaetota bacterium]